MAENGLMRQRWWLWALLILTTAVFLRLHQLPTVPPGLTHDEADHGLSAWGVVQGERPLYFTVGYGREPLYDYATAAVMSVLGPTYLANRLTAVFFSLIMLVGMGAWTRHAFDMPTALMTTAGIAVGFWAVMSGRQALRSITLPALFTLATTCWWLAAQRQKQVWVWYSVGGILLGLTFYTYIPSRILWLLFPLTALYITWQIRPFPPTLWRGTTLMLLIAGLVGSPLFLYLRNNPQAEVRIGQLSEPLTAVLNGDWTPLLTNISGALQLFTIKGDSFIRYNVAAQPWLNSVMGLLFYAGLLVTVWHIVRQQTAIGWQRVSSFFALLWLSLGIAPVLVTGPELSSTQAIGMQPVLYLFPALSLRQLYLWGQPRWPQAAKLAAWHVPLWLFTITAMMTYFDYFMVWGNEPEVRVQYESAMMATMGHINDANLQEVSVSTITPGQFHTPALAQVVLKDEAVMPRWFDGRGSLIVPNIAQSHIILSGFAPLHEALWPYFETAVLADELPLRNDDLDRPLTVYNIEATVWQADLAGKMVPVNEVTVANLLQLHGHDLQTPQVKAGEQVQLVTWWQVQAPLPPPQEGVLFTHMLDASGVPIAQADRLDAPAEAWQTGDYLLQLHQFVVPAETAVGTYPLAVGFYTTPDGLRQPIYENGNLLGDVITLSSVEVVE